ncbi:MAG: peptide-methionine (S)-S-oxide reductase MsrA [Nitrospiraceae bacterium]
MRFRISLPSSLFLWLSLSIVLVTLGSVGCAAATDASGTTSVGQVERAVFAGGCFWCMEEAFEGVLGVRSVVSGYTGGTLAQPTYEQVSAGGTGHAESVEVQFDPTVVDFPTLLDVFWRNVDPTVADRQFCDQGTQYRPAIFYRDEVQRRAAEVSRERVERTKRFPDPLKVQIVAAMTFYPAEEFHQDYYRRNPIRYKYYKYSCGRAQRLEELWGKPKG